MSTVVDHRIFKRGGGGHKIMDAVVFKNTHVYNHQTTRWEVVKNSASPKRPFFVCVFRAILPIFRAFPL